MTKFKIGDSVFTRSSSTPPAGDGWLRMFLEHDTPESRATIERKRKAVFALSLVEGINLHILMKTDPEKVDVPTRIIEDILIHKKSNIF